MLQKNYSNLYAGRSQSVPLEQMQNTKKDPFADLGVLGCSMPPAGAGSGGVRARSPAGASPAPSPAPSPAHTPAHLPHTPARSPAHQPDYRYSSRVQWELNNSFLTGFKKGEGSKFGCFFLTFFFLSFINRFEDIFFYLIGLDIAFTLVPYKF